MAFFKNVFGICRAMNIMAAEMNNTNRLLLSIASSLQEQTTIQRDASKRGAEMMDEGMESRSQVNDLMSQVAPQLLNALKGRMDAVADSDDAPDRLNVEPTAGRLRS